MANWAIQYNVWNLNLQKTGKVYSDLTYCLQDFLLRHWNSKNTGSGFQVNPGTPDRDDLWYLETSVIDIDSILPTIWNMFLHPSSKTRKICRYRGDAHHSTFCWRISPWLIIWWKYTKMTTASKINVIHWNQRIGWFEEFGMKNNFDLVPPIIVKFTISQLIGDRILKS